MAENGNNPWPSLVVFIFTILEILFLAATTVSFLNLKPYILSYNPPDFLISSLGVAKFILLSLESVFVVFSLIVSSLLILLKKADDIGTSWNLFKGFCSEMLCSFLFMVLMFAVTIAIGFFQDSFNEDVVPIEIDLIYYVSVIAFYVMLAMFVALLTVSMFSTANARFIMLRKGR
ncbi:hypothetical protein NBZ79_13035 [Sneathiella marina]|uniref:Uncharacterized protein n=1 Tax=Sneathiella marina TaxID=2950108 RepID=A0ABY4VZE8_9PROT|nr:hypothetical protein [Sneathiella marina]USG60099.1 hypothetical protein NBZ79_13035 [Sneathiella marina]